MTVFTALYNPYSEESQYMTLSIHRTREGAEQAIEDHKEQKRKEWLNIYPIKEAEPFAFDSFRDWRIEKMKVLA